MVTISLPEDEAQRFLAWIINAPGAWLIINPVIQQLVAQLQQQQPPAASRAPARQEADGADRASP